MTGQIPRGADLAVIAEDVAVVMWWCMRTRIKRPQQPEQTKRALMARLGRIPLLDGDGGGQ